jgi:hypothetical protein
MALGVPEMEQLVLPRLSPEGKAGVMLQPVIVPPVEPGVCAVIAVPLVATRDSLPEA